VSLLLRSEFLVNTIHDLQDLVVISLGSLELASLEQLGSDLIQCHLLGDGRLDVGVQHLHAGRRQTTNLFKRAVRSGTGSLVTHLLLQLLLPAEEFGFLVLEVGKMLAVTAVGLSFLDLVPDLVEAVSNFLRLLHLVV